MFRTALIAQVHSALDGPAANRIAARLPETISERMMTWRQANWQFATCLTEAGQKTVHWRAVVRQNRACGPCGV